MESCLDIFSICTLRSLEPALFFVVKILSLIWLSNQTFHMVSCNPQLAFTRLSCWCATGPFYHLGSPSGHPPSGMAGTTDRHRPSGWWNGAGWTSGHWKRQSGQRRAPTTGGATTRGALQRAHPAPMGHIAAWGWGHDTSSMLGKDRSRALTERMWWSARSWR